MKSMSAHDNPTPQIPKLRPSSMTTDRHDAKVINPFRDGEALAGSSVNELNLTHMVQRREQTQARVAQTADELERLRGQREELERERRRLETMEQRQVKFEDNHRELHDGLAYRMELLRKMDLEASRRAELFAAVRRRFEEMAREVVQLREQAWEEDRYDEELNRALAILEDIQREYNRAWSRVEAVTAEAIVSRTPADASSQGNLLAPSPPSFAKGFMVWLQIGAAVSLPLILVLLLLFVLSRLG